MTGKSVGFDSPNIIEAGRIACEKARLIAVTTRHGEISLVIRDGIVVDSHTRITEHHQARQKKEPGKSG